MLRPGIAKDVEVSTVPGSTSEVGLSVPSGWSCDRLGPASFRLYAAGSVDGRNTILVEVDGGRADFVMLGPDEALGYEAGANVPNCPECKARIEACMCES